MEPQADAIAQYGQQIVDRLNLDRGRVRPNFSLDASAGVDLCEDRQAHAARAGRR